MVHRLTSGTTAKLLRRAAVASTVHIAVSTGDLMQGVLALLTALLTVAWSVTNKQGPSDSQAKLLRDVATSIAALITPALVGWLHARGISLTGAAPGLEAAAILSADTLGSRLAKPDHTFTSARDRGLDGVLWSASAVGGPSLPRTDLRSEISNLK